MADSLLFIPDISGFSEFVTQTEIQHSQHIIAELLDLVLASNQLKMQVSEIEGDAVLFYRFEDVPTAEELIDQVRTLFVRFHTHLRQYDRDRVCQCGACSNASGLTLKVVIHAGQFDFIKIRNHKKLHGKAVIVAHRLLKNEIEGGEYALFSQAFDPKEVSASALNNSWASSFSGSATYSDVGKMEYTYIPLTNLHAEVRLPDPPPLPERQANPIVAETVINCSASTVFELLTNLDYRMLWNKAAQELEFEKGQLNRAGMEHICVFPTARLRFRTLSGASNNDDMVYGEVVDKFPLLQQFANYFVVTPLAEHQCKLRGEAHLKPYPWIGKLLALPVQKQLKRNMPKTLHSLKRFAESEKGIEEYQTDAP
ncbi:MAG: DUF2652 domain-containing protein [Salibacteraceae bacterium]